MSRQNPTAGDPESWPRESDEDLITYSLAKRIQTLGKAAAMAWTFTDVESEDGDTVIQAVIRHSPDVPYTLGSITHANPMSVAFDFAHLLFWRLWLCVDGVDTAETDDDKSSVGSAVYLLACKHRFDFEPLDLALASSYWRQLPIMLSDELLRISSSDAERLREYLIAVRAKAEPDIPEAAMVDFRARTKVAIFCAEAAYQLLAELDWLRFSRFRTEEPAVPETEPVEQFKTVAAIAKWLDCSDDTIRRMWRDGRLPIETKRKPNGVYVIPRKLLESLRASIAGNS